MKKLSNISLVFSLMISLSTSAQNGLQEATIKINNAANQGQGVVQGTQNALYTIQGAVETTKKIGVFGRNIIKSLKGNKKQPVATEATASTAPPTASASVAAASTEKPETTIYFDSVDYFKLSALKDELSAEPAITAVKMHLKDGVNYLRFSCSGDGTSLLAAVLKKWSTNYAVASFDQQEVRLKAK